MLDEELIRLSSGCAVYCSHMDNVADTVTLYLRQPASNDIVHSMHDHNYDAMLGNVDLRHIVAIEHSRVCV
jgi:hypothetical protein